MLTCMPILVTLYILLPILPVYTHYLLPSSGKTLARNILSFLGWLYPLCLQTLPAAKFASPSQSSHQIQYGVFRTNATSEGEKDARNRKAIFYDKGLRTIPPTQCFDAAIEDGTNTIFIAFGDELAVDEEAVASVSQALGAEQGRQAKNHQEDKPS